MGPTSLTEFLNELERYAPREDSYDLTSWQTFTPNERAQAEQALLQAATNADPRALVTLGHLKLTSALPLVRAQLNNPHAWVRFAAHRALYDLEGNLDGLLQDSGADNPMIVRFGAVHGLGKAQGAEAEQALLGALEDPDGLVRSLALDGLIKRYGLLSFTQDAAGETQPESPLQVLNLLLMADIAPLWQQAAGEAHQLFAALAAGKQPKELGLQYVPTAPSDFREKVAESFFDLDKPFSIELIAAYTGHDRQWAEAFLALQLEDRNPRAVQALAALNARWAGLAIQASAEGLKPDSPYARLAAQALQQLKSK